MVVTLFAKKVGVLCLLNNGGSLIVVLCGLLSYVSYVLHHIFHFICFYANSIFQLRNMHLQMCQHSFLWIKLGT